MPLSLRYENHIFFAVPIACDRCDMEFKIYDEDGVYIGTNFTGIQNPSTYSKEEKQEIENFLETELHKMEAKIKFKKEFDVTIENAHLLDLPPHEILERMEQKWFIPIDIMDTLLK